MASVGRPSPFVGSLLGVCCDLLGARCDLLASVVRPSVSDNSRGAKLVQRVSPNILLTTSARVTGSMPRRISSHLLGKGARGDLMVDP